MDISLTTFYIIFAILVILLLGIYTVIETKFLNGQASNGIRFTLILLFINLAMSIHASVVSSISYYNTQRAIADFNQVITNKITSINDAVSNLE
jgi:hypothetical protein